MNIRKDIKLEGKHGRPVLMDACYVEDGRKKPLLIFVHGFKGFKDWGHWGLMGEAFAKAGFYFVKFNFSHNGTTPDAPLNFADLEAFGNNNYSKEWADVDVVLDWLAAQKDGEYDLNNICLIGHSRGGGLSIAKATADERIHRLITLASVAELGYAKRHPHVLVEWEKNGVYYIKNGRTGQNMPLYYQLHQDILDHPEKFDLDAAAQGMKKPWLIIHGDEDPAVNVSAAHQMKKLCPSARLEILKGANHVFGGKHPYLSDTLPENTSQLVTLCLDFLQ